MSSYIKRDRCDSTNDTRSWLKFYRLRLSTEEEGYAIGTYSIEMHDVCEDCARDIQRIAKEPPPKVVPGSTKEIPVGTIDDEPSPF